MAIFYNYFILDNKLEVSLNNLISIFINIFLVSQLGDLLFLILKENLKLKILEKFYQVMEEFLIE